MHTEQLPDSEACWALLERIASSATLKRSARLQELLLYIGKRSLKDGCERVQEQEIGSKIFRRPESYDTNADNIVRTNVSDLRRRVEMYFHVEGAHETLTMEIPRGSYVPVFRYRPDSAENTPRVAAAFRGESESALRAEVHSAQKLPGWVPVTLATAAVLVAVLAVGCLCFWNRYQALHQPLYTWQSNPSVAELWSQFLDANPNTDLVISDTSIGLAEALSHKTFPLNDYLNRSYISQLQAADMSPDMHAAVNRILSWNLANPDEFNLARRILALDPLGRNIRLYNAHNYMPDLIKRDNVILIGARKSNPWDELFDDRINFITEFDNPRVINRAPAKGEPLSYLPTGSDGYCIVAYLPNSNHNGAIMLIEGTNAEATEAAGDFLLSEEQLSAFKKKLHASVLPYFQVLLKVSAVRGTPLSISVEAYRTYPLQ